MKNHRTFSLLSLAFCAATAMAFPPATAPSAGPALPPGHPPIDMKAAATSRPSSAVGSVTVKVHQKTAGGPSLAGEKVVVHLFQGETQLKHTEGTLDRNSSFRVNNIQISGHPIQAVAMIPHGQVTYQTAANLDVTAPNAKAEVDVYEISHDVPAWKISMRHLILSNTPQGVGVIEMLAAENPSDRTWVGTDKNEGATLIVKLPEGVMGLELGDNFNPGAVHLHNGTLFNIAPMTPGSTLYKFAYTVPVSGGKAVIPVNSPALTQQIRVFVPDDGTKVDAVGLMAGETRDMHSGKVRIYQMAGVPAGTPAALTISGLPDTPKAGATGDSWSMPKILGLSAFGVILLGGVAFMFLKPAPKGTSKRSN